MIQTTELIETLGKAGLLERLDEKTKDEGLSRIQELTDSVRNKQYKRTIEIGDDFIPNIRLYNAVGAIYPLLDKEQKIDAIRAHLYQFDGLNYSRVNTNHTPNIREPLLLTDIGIVRPNYWPGLCDEEHLWKNKPNFKLEDIITENGLFDPSKVKSDFLVAYALMRKDFTEFSEDYIKSANPEFLERVIKGVVSLRLARSTNDKEIENGINRLYELLPESVHNKINTSAKESDWIDYRIFQ